MLRTLAASLVLAATTFSGQVAHADSCSPARVMVLLDKSSSMQTGSIGGATKWSIAVDGLGQLLENHQAKAEFGLMTFPQPNQCGPGPLHVPPAPNKKSPISADLAAPAPTPGNHTPESHTLDAAAEEVSLQSAPGTRNVVLITDGWQYCVPYDPSTRFDGTPAVQALNANNIKTWVVGFGAEVDAAALNKMAVAAGTAKAGCNPNGEDPAAPDNCYFQVDNAAELVAALNQIAGPPSGEVRDSAHNDSAGPVDEDLRRSCDSACGAGTETCVAGAWSGCTAPAASPETCDGDDNDCDGEVDEDGSMCGSGEVCLAGECQPPNEETGEFGATQAGCACDTNGAGSPAALLPFVALGFIVIRRRRR